MRYAFIGLDDTLARISRRELNNLCPFYCVVTSGGLIEAIGSSLVKLLRTTESKLIKQPISLWLDTNDENEGNDGVALTNIPTLHQRPLRVITRNTNVELACEVVALASRKPFWRRAKQDQWLILMRPLLNSYDEIEQCGLNLQDFNLIDPVRTNLLTMLMEESLREDLLSAISENEAAD